MSDLKYLPIESDQGTNARQLGRRSLYMFGSRGRPKFVPRLARGVGALCYEPGLLQQRCSQLGIDVSWPDTRQASRQIGARECERLDLGKGFETSLSAQHVTTANRSSISFVTDRVPTQVPCKPHPPTALPVFASMLVSGKPTTAELRKTPSFVHRPRQLENCRFTAVRRS